LKIEPSLICLFIKDGKVEIRANGGCLGTVRRWRTVRSSDKPRGGA